MDGGAWDKFQNSGVGWDMARKLAVKRVGSLPMAVFVLNQLLGSSENCRRFLWPSLCFEQVVGFVSQKAYFEHRQCAGDRGFSWRPHCYSRGRELRGLDL